MITVGFGAVAGVTADELLAAIDAVLPPDIDDVRLTTLAARAAEAGPVTAAARRGWPITGYSPAQLAAVAVPSPSARVAFLAGDPGSVGVYVADVTDALVAPPLLTVDKNAEPAGAGTQ